MAGIGCSRINHKPEEYANPGEPVTGDIVFKHDLSDPQGINPFTTSDNSAKNFYMLIFDALMEQNPETSEFEPSIAEDKPIISEDHLRFTYKLRKDVHFSDGHPLTAKDVVFSFKTMKNPLIVDASAARSSYSEVKDVFAPDDYTVEISMHKPFFPAEIQNGDLRILPKHIMDPQNLTDQYTIPQTDDTNAVKSNKAMQKFADWFGSADLNRNPKYLIGSGPYIFSSWQTGERIILTRDPNYWNKESKWRRAYPDKIVGIVINDRAAAISAMKTENIDFFENVPPVLYMEQMDTSKINYVGKGEYVVSYYTYIGWNTTRPMFADKRVRQAMCHFVNRDYMIKSLMRGFAKPTDGPEYLSRPEYDTTLVPYDYNPEKARKLLTDAGWSDSNGDGILDKMIDGKLVNFEFKLSFNAGNEIRENIAILLSNELKKYGIKCNVQKLEWSVFLKQNSSHNFDAYIGAWVNDNIPSDPYQIWHSSQTENEGSNYVSFKNKRCDELIERNRTEFDPEKRKELMREFQQIVHEEAPYTFLWNPISLALYNKRLANMKFYNVRPGYLTHQWFIPKRLQSYAVQQ